MMIHPAVGLYVWISALIILQCLPRTAMLVLALILFLLAVWLTGDRIWRLMRRVRWLLMTLFVLFAFFTPGERVWSMGWHWVAPTHEGMVLAAEHAGRLLGAVAMVALLLRFMTTLSLVKALHACLSPLSILSSGKFPAETLAIRLMLVLQYLEEAPRKNWRQWLLDDGSATEWANESIVLQKEKLNALSLCLLILVTACWLGLIWKVSGNPA